MATTIGAPLGRRCLHLHVFAHPAAFLLSNTHRKKGWDAFCWVEMFLKTGQGLLFVHRG